MGYLPPPLSTPASVPIDQTPAPAPAPADQSTAPVKSGSSYLPPSLPADTGNPAENQPEHGYLWNVARTFGDQAIAPHTLDRILASGPGGSGDVQKEAAISQHAEDQLGLSGSFFPKWAGQELSIANAARFIPYAGPAASTPVVQGVLTGGLGQVMLGDFNPYDIAKESAKSAAGYLGGQIVGKYGGDLLKSVTGTSFSGISKQAQDAVDNAFAANSSKWGKTIADKIGVDNLNELHDLYKRGGDVAARAEELAQSAGGAAKTAYQNIAAAVNKTVEPGPYAAAAGIAAAHLGDVGASAWPAIQRVAKYVNQGVHGIDVRNAIDQAYQPVSSFVRSNIDPQKWANAGAPAVQANYNQLYQKGLDAIHSFSY